MKLVTKISFLLGMLLYFTHGTAFAADNFGECYGCSYAQQEAVAVNSANQYFNVMGDGLFRIHIVDMGNFNITSFSIWDIDGARSISTYATPTNIETYMTDVKGSINNLSVEAKSVVIPKTVLDSPWRYTNCSFCKNDITSYIQSTLSGKIQAATLTVLAISQAFDLVKTTVPNQFSFPLEGGGQAIIELGISAESDLIIKIIDVIDESNNSVPKTASSLRDLQVRLELGQAEVVNGFINQFSFYVPLRTGIVIIRDCPSTGCNTNKP